MRQRDWQGITNVANEILMPLKQWHRRCHEASIAIIESCRIANLSIARGACNGVGGQHSWVVCGHDAYAENVWVIDPTLWSYRKDVQGIYVGPASKYRHLPHGDGNIFNWGRPNPPIGPVKLLRPPEKGWSKMAEIFLESLGPLDKRGWEVLANAPVRGWPAFEILGAILEDEDLRHFVPIDVVGMAFWEKAPKNLYPRS